MRAIILLGIVFFIDNSDNIIKENENIRKSFFNFFVETGKEMALIEAV